MERQVVGALGGRGRRPSGVAQPQPIDGQAQAIGRGLRPGLPAGRITSLAGNERTPRPRRNVREMPTGVAEVDELLAGGLPRERLTSFVEFDNFVPNDPEAVRLLPGSRQMLEPGQHYIVDSPGEVLLSAHGPCELGIKPEAPEVEPEPEQPRRTAWERMDDDEA